MPNGRSHGEVDGDGVSGAGWVRWSGADSQRGRGSGVGWGLFRGRLEPVGALHRWQGSRLVLTRGPMPHPDEVVWVSPRMPRRARLTAAAPGRNRRRPCPGRGPGLFARRVCGASGGRSCVRPWGGWPGTRPARPDPAGWCGPGPAPVCSCALRQVLDVGVAAEQGRDERRVLGQQPRRLARQVQGERSGFAAGQRYVRLAAVAITRSTRPPPARCSRRPALPQRLVCWPLPGLR